MPESWKNLIELWCNSEPVLYLIGNEQGKLYFARTMKYAPPITANFKKEIESREAILQDDTASIEEQESVTLETIEDLKQFCRTVQQSERNYSLNFQNICKSSTRSNFESRISAGTTNADEIINHINLFGSIVKVAEEIAVIQKKPLQERTAIETKKIDAFINLTTKPNTVEQKLELLLEILDFKQELEKIYRERYRSNYDLALKDPDLMKIIIISHEVSPVNLNSIFKKTMLEDEPVTGQDYGLVMQYMEFLHDHGYYLQN